MSNHLMPHLGLYPDEFRDWHGRACHLLGVLACETDYPVSNIKQTGQSLLPWVDADELVYVFQALARLPLTQRWPWPEQEVS